MNMRRALSVTRRIFWDLRNDRGTLSLMFLAPALAIIVFGLAFSGDVSHVRVVVVNQDEGYQIPPATVPVSLANAIIANCDADVMSMEEVATEEEGLDRVQNGKAYGLIVFSSTFTKDVYFKALDPTLPINPEIWVELDKSNVNVASAISKAVSEGMLKAFESMGVASPANINFSHAVYAADANSVDFSVPGVMVVVIFLLTILLTLTSFGGERTSGTLERLQTTPLRESEVVIGYAFAYSAVGMLQTVVVLALGILVFDVMIVGNILLAFFVIALLAVGSLSLGILLSSLAKGEAQAIQFVAPIVLITLLLSGFLWPVEAIPTWLRPMSYAVPATYAVDAARSVMLRGWGIGRIWVDLVALFSFALVFLCLAVWSLRRSRT